MNSKHIITTLSHLQRLRIGGEPDTSWVRSSRAQLLARVAEQAPARGGARQTFGALRGVFSFNAATLVARPVLAGVLAVAAVMGSGVGAVSASLGSIPGDPLYQIKLASERARIAVAQSATDKATLRIEYVGRRVDEVTRIAGKPENDNSARLNTAVQHIKQDLGSVQQSLSDLSKTGEPADAAEVANLVDKKSEEYSAALEKTNTQLRVPEQVAVKEAKALVDDISVQAVAVLVQAHANGAVSNDDIAAKVGEKIDTITNKANLVANTSTSTPAMPGSETANQALTALGAAKDLLDQQDYLSALTKVIEGKELVQAAEKIIDATTGAAALSALSAASSTVADPLIVGGETTVGITPLTTSTTTCGTSSCQQPQGTSSASEPTGVSTSTSPSSGG
ncbi:hypothetical protein EPO33_02785 [Patescibacteria group bacterium]|nr:MAG: hypothetical protein EPO33_02785 [Patescibacteria group bacterium]